MKERTTRTTLDVIHTGPGGPVRVPKSEDDPARYAAGVVARRLYGRRGYCRTCRLDSWAPDGSSHTYECFVGYTVGNGTTGRNIWVYV